MTEHALPESRWVHRRGALAREGWESVVDGTLPGWQHTGLRIAELAPGDRLDLAPAGAERIVVPLSGSVIVTHDEGGVRTETVLAGRASVFDGPTDVLYLSSAATGTITAAPAQSTGAPGSSTGVARVAVASSPSDVVRPTRHIRAEETPIELRGAGASSRQVHNFGTPEALDAARLIVCEVITPAGNWSSYPPHKHDERVPGHESRLEEIYYFESAPARPAPVPDATAPARSESAAVPPPADPDAAFGLFSTSSSPAGSIEIDARVRTGDIALVPFGYHGPAVAAPGYDLYYLNVMAGPDPERAWLISDDPAHAWVRSTWADESVDPRLPFTAKGRTP